MLFGESIQLLLEIDALGVRAFEAGAMLDYLRAQRSGLSACAEAAE